MKVFISETDETKTLKLFAIGEQKNIAKKFIKTHARNIFGKKKVKSDGLLAVFGDEEMTQSAFDEWDAILKTKQAALLAEHDYLAERDNTIHQLIQSELADSYQYQIRSCGFDKKFALKNAMDAELQILKRLAYGVIKVKNPVAKLVHPSKANTSDTLNIKHFRHKEDTIGEEWLMQVFCDFIMTMPDHAESFEFTAGIELEFHKVHDGEIEHIDDEKWIFPFSMGFDQEQAVLDALHGAAQRNFIRLGVEGGVKLETLNS